MKKLIFLIFLSLLFVQTFSQINNQNIFKRFDWGISSKTVKNNETCNLIKEGANSSDEIGNYRLLYEGSINNSKVLIEYLFYLDKLKNIRLYPYSFSTYDFYEVAVNKGKQMFGNDFQSSNKFITPVLMIPKNKVNEVAMLFYKIEDKLIEVFGENILECNGNCSNTDISNKLDKSYYNLSMYDRIKLIENKINGNDKLYHAWILDDTIYQLRVYGMSDYSIDIFIEPKSSSNLKY